LAVEPGEDIRPPCGAAEHRWVHQAVRLLRPARCPFRFAA